MFGYHGLIGLIILILDIWAIISVFSSNREVGVKVLWTVLIIILPFIGFIIWLFLGPRANR